VEQIATRLAELRVEVTYQQVALNNCKQELNKITTEIISKSGAILEFERLLKGKRQDGIDTDTKRSNNTD